ncbi:hypothetical protein AXK61_07385 [Tsukamurella pseudospumae]|uniref:AAA+ ATPase domain-containing protein n=1 Tax=Tsukamurella pseudospumae TaxID=239498 RepID=A0A137YXP3_9ACTN|nr:hypothetical protein AXK61_07385 [Tsukamurella pseudospumae]
MLSEFTEAASGLIGDREQAETFNIAFFGRTGAGKSTLLSILGRLDGERVSDGRSDFTTDVAPVVWNRCELWDTPGINGWGNPSTSVDDSDGDSAPEGARQRREQLEARARRAVEKADLVLLCFDSQSQQASEFRKMSAWVQEYGKPVIAVLNVRNARWRHSQKLAAMPARRTLSRAVAEHAGNIRAELDRIGLAGTPIVAYHAQRALFARASEPYSGPAASSMAVEREKFGKEYLLASSNFPALEQLIVGAIANGAASLRKTSMRDGLRGAADRAALALTDMAADVQARVNLTDVTAAKLIEVLGYPEEDGRADLLGEGEPLIQAAENARGGPFAGTASGSIDRYFERLLDKHLAALRQYMLREIESLVESHLDDGKDTTVEEVRAVYDRHRDDLKIAVSEVWAAAGAFLDRKVSVALAGGEREIGLNGGAAVGHDDGVKGIIGRILRSVGIAAGAASGVLVLPSVANFWNPGGWVGGAAVVGLNAVGMTASMVGEKLSTDGEKDSAAHRSRALAAARDAVNESFDEVEADVRRAFHEQKWVAAAPHVNAALAQLVTVHDYARSVPAATAQIGLARDRIRSSPQPGLVIARATEQVLASRRRESGAALSADDLWLGEDWIDSECAESTEIDAAVREQLGAASGADRTRLDDLLAGAWSPVDEVDFVAWCQEVVAAVDGATRERIEAVRARFDGIPSIVVVGDYSAGKSSLVKRLLVEVGASSPREIRISGSVATDTVQVCDAGHFRVVDSPGFQSGRAGHDEVARMASVGAALVIIVVHVNLMIGDTELIEEIVVGSDTAPGKGRRVLFLVNRADELGADPTVAPEDFARLKELKAAELRTALMSRSIDIDPLQVHLVAGDPFGQFADRPSVVPADFDEHRAWDGIDPLKSALLGFSRGAARAGAARGLIDEVSAILGTRAQLIATEVAVLEAEDEETSGLRDALTDAVNAARILEGSVRTRVAKLVRARTERAIDEIRKVVPGDGAGLQKATEWADEDLWRELDRLFRAVETECQHLIDEHTSAIQRELELSRVELAGGPTDTEPAEKVDAPGGQGGGAADIGAKAFGISASLAKALGNRNAAYAIGKMAGVKFKPWGAVNAGKTIGKAAPILSFVGAGLDAYKMRADAVAKDKMSAAKVSAVEAVRASGAETIDAVMRGDDERQGPGSVLSAFSTTVRGFDDELSDAQSESARRRDELLAESERIIQLLAAAGRLTRTNSREY